MGKPVERQNHSLSFFILASLIAICTAWAFYEEFLGRRPWKGFQEQIFEFEREKASLDLMHVERKLESGEIAIRLDPSKPDETITVKQAEERLKSLDQKLAERREEISKLQAELKEAEVVASDADLHVKMLRSEDDGLFYEFQHAQHQEAITRATAKKLRDEGKTAEADRVEKEADVHKDHVEEKAKEREEKAKEIAQAVVDAEKATKHLEEVQSKLQAIVGEREKLKAAIEGAMDPVLSAKTALETAKSKSTELTQYWLTSYDNSVDRCQNCHATVDKCGYSRPHEILAALEKPDAVAEEVQASFCVNPDTVDNYKATAEAICGLEWDRAQSEKGAPKEGTPEAQQVRCVDGEARAKIAEFVYNYCGEKAPAYELLSDQHLQAACLSNSSWETLAGYVQDPTRRGPPDKAWSACDVPVGTEGDSCVEGAARDQLITYLEDRCPETSVTLAALKKNKKVCASGEEGKKLASVKPVLFDLPVWAQTHPYRAELFGSNHPPDRFGCTSCHEGQGAQTKGIAGAEFQHGYDDHYWEKPMLDLVTRKKFRPQTWGPPPSTEGVPGEWVTHQKHFVQATCSKCHVDEISLPHAETYSKGRKLVAEIGCHGCHPIDAFAEFPKLGPTLTDLKQKTTPAFLVKWISYPKAFRPRTKMPNFWPEALDAQLRPREGSPEWNQRQEEVQKIAAYLWKNSEPAELPAPPVAGDAERGKVLVQQVGCRACHNLSPVEKLCTPEQIAQEKMRGTPQEPGECEVPRSLTASASRDFAPNLSNIGLKTNERWLYAWLKNPSALWKQSRMPNLRLSDQEAADIAAYLMTQKAGDPLPEQPLFANEGSPEFERAAEEGHKLVTKYGCAGCHDIKGHENDPKIGADLNEYGRKTVDLLDFGNAIPNPRHHSWFNFVDLKLRAPRAYRYERAEARMPQFDLTDDEVASIMTFLKSRTSEKVPAAYLVSNSERLTAMAHGEQTMEFYNCKGCHVIEGDGGRIRDMYLVDDLAKAPPILQAQGWRVQPDWFFDFLKDPSERLRPWLDVRMPTFPLSDQGATSIVKGLAAHSKVPYPYISTEVEAPKGKDLEEVKAMVAELRCFACHTSGEPEPGQDRSSLAPNLLLAKHRLRPDWVSAWIKNPQSLQDGTKMPSFFTPDDMSTVMYPNYFGGSQEKQIEMLRNYVMTLSDGTSGQPQAAAQKKGR